jgi:hypothetical protein
MKLINAKEVRNFLKNPQGKNAYLKYYLTGQVYRVIDARNRAGNFEVRILSMFHSAEWLKVEGEFPYVN